MLIFLNLKIVDAMDIFAMIADARTLFELGVASFDATGEGIALSVDVHMLHHILLLCKFSVTDAALKSLQTKMVCLQMPFQAKLRWVLFAAGASKVGRFVLVEFMAKDQFDLIWDDFIEILIIDIGARNILAGIWRIDSQDSWWDNRLWPSALKLNHGLLRGMWLLQLLQVLCKSSGIIWLKWDLHGISWILAWVYLVDDFLRQSTVYLVGI